MRSLPQPLTRGWHLLLQSFTNHSSSSLVGQRAAPICGSLLHPHPFRVSKRAALWCTARHSAPLGHRHQLPVQIGCLAHSNRVVRLLQLRGKVLPYLLSLQPCGPWAVKSANSQPEDATSTLPSVWRPRSLCGGFQKAPLESYPVRGWMGPPGQGLCRHVWGHCTPQLGIFGAGSTPPLNKARGPRFPSIPPCTKCTGAGKHAEQKPNP